MLGNDFLPHPPSLSIRHNGINNLQSLYCEIHKDLGYDLVYQDEGMSFQIRREFIVRMWKYYHNTKRQKLLHMRKN